MKSPNIVLKDYPALKRRVQETLLLGQKKIEEARVETYWQTGKLIDDHIRSYGGHLDH